MKIMFLTLLLLIGFAASNGAYAQADANDLPPLLDRALFFGDPEISGAQLSADGKYVAFQKSYNDVMNVWVKGIDEPFEAARPLTADERPVSGYFWSQDGRYILYVQDKGGDENYHVYAVDPSADADAATGVPAARDLTDAENVRAMIIDVPEDAPGEMLVGLNDRDASWHDVYRVNIETGERELLIENTSEIAGWMVDLDGNVRLALRIDSQTGSTEIRTVDNGSVGDVVYTCSVTESCGPVRFHKDGKRVYMVTNKGDRDLIELVLFDPATGEETLVERDPEGNVDFGNAVFSELTDELMMTVYNGDRLRLYPKQADLAADLNYLREQLPEGDVLPGSSTKNERMWLITNTRDVDPGSVYLFNRDTREIEKLYTSRPELPSEYLAEMQVVRYPARDGMEIPAYLTLPKGTEATNLPVIILPHGGPWARDGYGYNSFAQFLANRGYAVLQPNFRGSTGYGKAFLNAGNNEWGTGAMQHDLTDGVQYLIDQGIADPERVGIMGGSYGGYATLAGVTFTPDLYAAGVSIVGPSNLITLLESIPPYWEAVRTMFHERMGDPTTPEGKAQLEAQSPLNFADRITTPLLVVQGANDPRVKQRESDQIVVALRDRGYPVDYLVAADEGHGFRGELNRMAMMAEIEGFLAMHLGGRHQEDMNDELSERLSLLTMNVDEVVVTDPNVSDAMAVLTFDAAKVEPMTMNYAISMNAGGRTMEFENARTIGKAEMDGKAVVYVTDSAEMMGMAVKDSVVVDGATLSPISRTVNQGPATIDMSYSSDSITGEMRQGAQAMPIMTKLDAPVAADGAALDVLLTTLPLTVGYSGRYDNFDLATQQVKTYTLNVTGEETVTVPAGTYETFVVETAPADGGPATKMYITKAAPRMTVKSEGQLPPQMGGGTVTTSLSSMNDGGSK